MPRTAVTPQRATSTAAATAFEAANVLGNSYDAAKGRGFRIKNGSGSEITVTVPTPATADGLAIADRTITIAAGADHTIGLGSQAGIYAQSDGTIHVDYSAVTTVTVAVVDHP